MDMDTQDEEQEEQAGLILPEEGESLDMIDQYAYPILDDVLTNIIHDILLKAHRETRIAKAQTAALEIEALAAATFGASSPSSPSQSQEPKTPRKKSKAPQHLETDAAIYEDGIVTIKGNPLVTVHEILCSSCGLPKLLHPTDGNGARKPEPGKEYCKRHPYIDKPGQDVYGIPFPKDDSGSTRKKIAKPVPQNQNLLAVSGSQQEGESSFESSAPSPPPEVKDKPKAVIYPNVECPRCPRIVNVKVFARHLNGHLKGGGRASGRAAVLKINGQSASSSSQSTNTPPVSRKGTPLPAVNPISRNGATTAAAKSDSTVATSANRTSNSISPQKRTLDEHELEDDNDADFLDDDESPRKKTKKRKDGGLARSSSGAGASTLKNMSAPRPPASTTDDKKPSIRLSIKPPSLPSSRASGNSGSGSTAGPRPKVGMVKKWKSGKITVDGKMQSSGVTGYTGTARSIGAGLGLGDRERGASAGSTMKKGVGGVGANREESQGSETLSSLSAGSLG